MRKEASSLVPGDRYRKAAPQGLQSGQRKERRLEYVAFPRQEAPKCVVEPIRAAHPMGRMGDPEEVAEAVLTCSTTVLRRFVRAGQDIP